MGLPVLSLAGKGRGDEANPSSPDHPDGYGQESGQSYDEPHLHHGA